MRLYAKKIYSMLMVSAIVFTMIGCREEEIQKGISQFLNAVVGEVMNIRNQYTAPLFFIVLGFGLLVIYSDKIMAVTVNVFNWLDVSALWQNRIFRGVIWMFNIIVLVISLSAFFNGTFLLYGPGFLVFIFILKIGSDFKKELAAAA
ncbi:MAG: hypothetical protein R6W70_04075, partial [bacterium]